MQLPVWSSFDRSSGVCRNSRSGIAREAVLIYGSTASRLSQKLVMSTTKSLITGIFPIGATVISGMKSAGFSAELESAIFCSLASSLATFSLQANADRPLIRIEQLPQIVLRQFLRKAKVPSCSHLMLLRSGGGELLFSTSRV